MFEDLKGKRVLVTGASSGLGAHFARLLAGKGALVAAVARRTERLQDLARECEGLPGRVVPLALDVSSVAAIEAGVTEASNLLGGLDVLVNNAGALVKRTPIAEIEDDFFDSVVDLNVRSVVMASKAALPYLKTSGNRASVINLSSIAARNGGGPGSSLYASSKAFVLNLTRGMAKEFVPFGIRVNGVSPGVIMTPFHERYSTAEQIEAMRKTVPMERVGTPQDNVGVFLFLASPAMSGYITGQTIEVNGGQYMV